MELLCALTPEIRTVLFPELLASEASISPVVIVTDAIHFVGMSLSSELRFVVAFLKADDQASGDPDHLMSMASRWTVFFEGCQLDPGARIIKFFRAEATDDVFDPAQWPLPKPFTIWNLQYLLIQAMEMYAMASNDAKQFFYMAQSGALEGWYSRLERTLCAPSGPAGITLRVIARPAPDEGGFHGYERI